MNINTITPSSLKILIENNEDFQLVDIRELYELETEGKSDATHIPMGELLDRLAELSSDCKVIFHCSSGQRSSNILHFMFMNGMYKDNFYSLDGGFKAWMEIR